jgi:hypothetical protein
MTDPFPEAFGQGAWSDEIDSTLEDLFQVRTEPDQGEVATERSSSTRMSTLLSDEPRLAIRTGLDWIPRTPLFRHHAYATSQAPPPSAFSVTSASKL